MIQITKEPINVDEVLAEVRSAEAGALVHFIGTVRAEPGISALDYECYADMALKTMREIVSETAKKWPLKKVSVVHRVGRVSVGEASVVIAVSSAHRKEAFEACRFVIDEIKVRVPIWKKGGCCAH